MIEPWAIHVSTAGAITSNSWPCPWTAWKEGQNKLNPSVQANTPKTKEHNPACEYPAALRLSFLSFFFIFFVYFIKVRCEGEQKNEKG